MNDNRRLLVKQIIIEEGIFVKVYYKCRLIEKDGLGKIMYLDFKGDAVEGDVNDTITMENNCLYIFETKIQNLHNGSSNHLIIFHIDNIEQIKVSPEEYKGFYLEKLI